MIRKGGDEGAATDWQDRLRGQSETLAVVLVFGIVIAGATLVVAIGATAVGDSEDELTDQRAEKAMTQFSAKAGLVALQEADSQQVDFPTGQSEQYKVVEDTGWMNITWRNQTTGYTEEVMNMTLGALVYEGENTRIAYQGGGVFRATETGGRMISPPEFHYRGGTLTLPAINVTGDAAVGSRVTVSRSDVSRRFPTGVGNSTNPLDNHLVTVTVKSEYYRGWGQYFEERTDGEVEYDDSKETATLLMVTPIEVAKITAATSSLSASGSFTVNGNSALDCGGGNSEKIYTDSYNSSKPGDYCDQLSSDRTGTNGTVVYGDDVVIDTGAGGSGFCGDIVSGGSVVTQGGGPGGGSLSCGDNTGGQPKVFGNINYTNSCTDCSDAIVAGTGTKNKIDGVREAAAVDFFVNATVSGIDSRASGSNRNPSLSDGTVLDESEYYFDSLEINSNDEIELNTSSGNIDIAVSENIKLHGGAELEVTGDGFVRIFVDGDSFTGTNHLKMENDAAILTPEDNATQLRVYGKRDFTATLGGGGAGSLAKFVGVLYAPPGANGNGEIEINGAEVYGGILTGTTIIPNGGTGSIHYDEALRNERIIPPDGNQVKVTFLHVTVNEITVEG